VLEPQQVVKIEGYNGTFDVSSVPRGVIILVRDEDKEADDKRYVRGVRNFAVVFDPKQGAIDIPWPKSHCKKCMNRKSKCTCKRGDV
jgi:hypothetical protein